MVFEKMQDSGSWIFGAGVAHSEMGGLEQLKVISTTSEPLNTKGLSSMTSESLLAHATYSQNWFWSHWYVTLCGGLLENFSFSKKQYASASDSESRGALGTNLGLSAGYVGNNWLTGTFMNMSQQRWQIDDMDVYSTTGTTGLYVGVQF